MPAREWPPDPLPKWEITMSHHGFRTAFLAVAATSPAMLASTAVRFCVGDIAINR
ncbi:MAG TPA: hypothetical protein VL652_46495 [Kutzneria sp.]|jgi:hypothetical protein|nr:hypothetical protein [Kutzneria sp.]